MNSRESFFWISQAMKSKINQKHHKMQLFMTEKNHWYFSKNEVLNKPFSVLSPSVHHWHFMVSVEAICSYSLLNTSTIKLLMMFTELQGKHWAAAQKLMPSDRVLNRWTKLCSFLAHSSKYECLLSNLRIHKWISAEWGHCSEVNSDVLASVAASQMDTLFSDCLDGYWEHKWVWPSPSVEDTAARLDCPLDSLSCYQLTMATDTRSVLQSHTAFSLNLTRFIESITS